MVELSRRTDQSSRHRSFDAALIFGYTFPPMGDERKNILSLAKLLQDKNLRTQAVEALGRCLHADRHFIHDGEVVLEKDYKTQAFAAQIILAYTDGRPPQRHKLVLENEGDKGMSDEEIGLLMGRALRLPEARTRKIMERVSESSDGEKT